jgi:hypothetical protein
MRLEGGPYVFDVLPTNGIRFLDGRGDCYKLASVFGEKVAFLWMESALSLSGIFCCLLKGSNRPFLFLFLFITPFASQIIVRAWTEWPGPIAYVSDPVQSTWEAIAPPILLEKNGYIWWMYPRADYQIEARVLHSQEYDDWQAIFSPVDVALGWGKISDPAVDRWINWKQGDRWYHYNWSLDAPVTGNYISEHSANVHVIPASDNLAAVIRSLEPNDVVRMEGILVDVEAGAVNEPVLQTFQTSLTRSDSGDASCEILYMHLLEVDGEVHR